MLSKNKAIGSNTFRNCVVLALAVFTAATLTACGGTKVMTASKTIVYRDAIYNVSNTNVLTRKTEGIVSEDQVLDLDNVDEDAFEDILQEHQEVFVRQSFMLDETELVYQAMNVDNWNDYRRMDRRFDGAAKDVQKFLAKGKETQLKLK